MPTGHDKLHPHLVTIIVSVLSVAMICSPSVEVIQVLHPAIDVVSGHSIPTAPASSRNEILELIDNEWRQVATMQNARNGHRVTVINDVQDYWKFCK